MVSFNLASYFYTVLSLAKMSLDVMLTYKFYRIINIPIISTILQIDPWKYIEVEYL